MTLADPYRWLEDGDAPEVLQWTDAQDRHTRACLDAIPYRTAIRERLRALLSIGTITPPVPRRGWYFYERRNGTQEQPVLYAREGRDGVDRILLDPAVLSADGACALD